MKKEILLVGTGRMARHYAAILNALHATPIVIGKNRTSTEAFTNETGIPAQCCGVPAWKKSVKKIPRYAIVAVPADKLSSVALEVISAGCRRILLEKPGGLTAKEIRSVAKAARESGSKVCIAYNRRFLASVLKAKEYIRQDGGVTSFSFAFNEKLSQKRSIKKLGISAAVERRWFFVNATHVIDLAFYLGGVPKMLAGFSAAGPLWAPHPSLFSGAGITRKKIPFYYSANWELPGPWSVEIGTKKRKLILSPLETLKTEENGIVRDIALSNSLDKRFKPGLYRQVKAFLGAARNIPTPQEHIEIFRWFEKIERGTE